MPCPTLPARIAAALILWPAALPASAPPPGDAPPLIAFFENGEPRFEVWMHQIVRHDVTRARTGAPKLAVYLDEENTERYRAFVRAHRGGRLAVFVCGEFLGSRLITEPGIPGRIKVIFMDTERSRAFRIMLEVGEGC